MRNVRHIFFSDVRSIVKHFFVIVVVLATGILPALYAWVNIYANGNPYENTGSVPIAVASEDKGIDKKNGKHINDAEELIEELKESTGVGWEPVKDAKTAEEGVRSGKYYAAVVFKDGFTYNMHHFDVAVGDEEPYIICYSNAKKNAIATKIADTAIGSLQDRINTTYIETVFERYFKKGSKLSKEMNSEGAVDEAVEQLVGTRDSLRQYIDAIDTFTADSEDIQNKISSARGGIQNKRNNVRSKASAARSRLSEGIAAVNDVRAQIDAKKRELSSAQDELEAAIDEWKGAKDDKSRAKALQLVKKRVAKHRRILNGLRALIPDDPQTGAAKTAKEALDRMIARSDRISELAAKAKGTAKEITEVRSELTAARSLFKDSLSPGLDGIISEIRSTLESFEPLLASAGNVVDTIDPLLSSTGKTAASLDDSLRKLRKVLKSLEGKLNTIIRKVKKAKKSDKAKVLAELLGGDPEAYAQFFAEPVEIETKEIYTVGAYGAAMTPFYSILALWVGAVVLVSLLNTHVDREKFPGCTDRECFFGRFVIFGLLGQLQALIIVLGDIYLLKVDPADPFLMWATAAFASLVFVLLIYSVVMSFGDIGKGAIVVVMVLQIAGSSGSYPIEVLPEVFNKIYTFFPFPYGINAMREAICGTYGNDWARYIGQLLVFGVVGLLIGLFVRQPFKGVNEFVSEKLEETEII